MSLTVHLPGGKVEDLVKIWTDLGIPENEAERYIKYLNDMVATADPQLVRRFRQHTSRLGTKYPREYKKGLIRWIGKNYPRMPQGAPRKHEVNLVEQLMEEGASNRDIVIKIKGIAEVEKMTEKEINQLASELRKPVSERKRRRRRVRSKRSRI